MNTGASFNRATSRQDYETPTSLILAVENRFGKIGFDLAASTHNAKAKKFFSVADDSLSQDWSALNPSLLWLNPPFANIAPWAEKCWRSSQQGCRILFLVPGSVGANWFGKFVLSKSHIMALSPRLQFVGAKDPYPKDCILCGFGFPTAFEFWRWNELTQVASRE